jgi:hypothetical protein
MWQCFRVLKKTCHYLTGFPKFNLSRYYLFSNIAVFSIYSRLKRNPLTEYKILCKVFSKTRSASLCQTKSGNYFQVQTSILLKRRTSFESSIGICADPSNTKRATRLRVHYHSLIRKPEASHTYKYFVYQTGLRVNAATESAQKRVSTVIHIPILSETGTNRTPSPLIISPSANMLFTVD